MPISQISRQQKINWKKYCSVGTKKLQRIKIKKTLGRILFLCIMLATTMAHVLRWLFLVFRINANFRNFKLKLERFLPIKIPKENDQILRISVMGRCQNVPKFDFQSQFFMSKFIGIFPNFSLKNINLEAHFLLLTSLMTSIFK